MHGTLIHWMGPQITKLIKVGQSKIMIFDYDMGGMGRGQTLDSNTCEQCLKTANKHKIP